MYRREGSFRGPKVRPYEMGDKIAASDFDPAFKPRTPPRQPMLPASPAGLAVAFLPQLGRWSFLLVLIQLYPRAGSLTEPAAEAGEGRERAVLPGSAAPREGGCGPTRGCAVPPRGAAAALPPAPRPGRPPANPRTRPSGLPSSPTTPPATGEQPPPRSLEDSRDVGQRSARPPTCAPAPGSCEGLENFILCFLLCEVEDCGKHVSNGILTYFLNCVMFSRRLRRGIICRVDLNLHGLSWVSA